MKNGGGSSLLAGPRKGDTGKIRGVHAFLMERDLERAGRTKGAGNEFTLERCRDTSDRSKERREEVAWPFREGEGAVERTYIW